jgi:hypothetical protein
MLSNTLACTKIQINENKTLNNLNNIATQNHAADLPYPGSETGNFSLSLPMDWSIYEIQPSDLRYTIEGFKFQRFAMEYPSVFKLADINRASTIPELHWSVGATQIKFLYGSNEMVIPYGVIKVAIWKIGYYSMNTIDDVVKQFELATTTQYVKTQSSLVIDEIPATQIECNIPQYKSGSEINGWYYCKLVIFEHRGDFWQISLEWKDKTNVPSELDAYFQHVVATFHFLN